ncbi:MAG: hypothetical protein A2137_03930 [Chloroflexi bacterium RBG_16_58_8]|nr:MAG: hypothetical protein A2137_03930 [Chloroflexi bacterium RBG_16_58_8]
METLEYAGVLHDVGKIGIDSQLLEKPGALTEAEWEIMRQHPAFGANLLKEIAFLEKASTLVLCHHERYDGSGYPGGLKGNDIPMGARLIAVADAFDTMTTDRAYRPAMTTERALKEMEDCAGKQFCPMAVRSFVTGLRVSLGTGQ